MSFLWHPLQGNGLLSIRTRLKQRCGAAASAPIIKGPPASYDFRADIMPETREIIQSNWPQLQDLVDEGALVVHQRPTNYVERRTDGYQEPDLVFVVGTAHVSSKSAEDVKRVVEAVQPDCVVVELCRSRTALLHGASTDLQPQQQQQQQQQQLLERETAADGSFEEHQLHQQHVDRVTSHQHASSSSPSSVSCVSNPLGLSGSSFVEAMQRALSQGGQSGLVLRLLLASQARRAADRLGVRAGAEFAAAARAADAVGAQLVLGDRPIDITLSRGWGALGWGRRGALLADLLRAAVAPLPELSAEFIESLKTDGAVNSMFSQLSDRYPELVAPLVAERDLYLAWSLKRSKAVNSSKRVVGVIGKGHMQGVVYALRHDRSSLRFADLVGGLNRKAERRKEAARRLAIELAIGAAAYALWIAFT